MQRIAKGRRGSAGLPGEHGCSLSLTFCNRQDLHFAFDIRCKKIPDAYSRPNNCSAGPADCGLESKRLGLRIAGAVQPLSPIWGKPFTT